MRLFTNRPFLAASFEASALYSVRCVRHVKAELLVSVMLDSGAFGLRPLLISQPVFSI
jgi:hypothetical protein